MDHRKALTSPLQTSDQTIASQTLSKQFKSKKILKKLSLSLLPSLLASAQTRSRETLNNCGSQTTRVSAEFSAPLITEEENEDDFDFARN